MEIFDNPLSEQCVEIKFNAPVENCNFESSTASSGESGSVYWENILGKPSCFPACLEPLDLLFTPLVRQLTINGVTQDLSVNRSWTIDSLPLQTGNAGKFLTTNGSIASWTVVDLTAYLPYIGATSDLNLGLFSFLSQAITLNSATADRILATNATKQLVSLSTTTYPSLTELSYVKGVTSAIQTQLNGKQNTLTNPVTGTGTTNYLPKFTGASTIGNSQIIDNGTAVGIGTTTLSGGYMLNVGGLQRLIGANTLFHLGELDANNVYLQSLDTTGASSRGFVFFGASEYARITNAGNLVIGTTSAFARLHARGSGATSGSINFLLENNSATKVLTSYDNGAVIIGDTSTVPTRAARLYIFQGGTASNRGIILNHTSLDEFNSVGIWAAPETSYNGVNIGAVDSTSKFYTNIDVVLGVRSAGFFVNDKDFGNSRPSFWANTNFGTNVLQPSFYANNIAVVSGIFGFNPSINYLNGNSFISRNTVNLNTQAGVISNSYQSFLMLDTINETIASSTTTTTGILHLPILTSAYNYRAFEFGILSSGIGGTTSYTPNAGVTDYRWGIINPIINASVNNQLINALDVVLSGSDGAFTGVTRNALRLRGGDLNIFTVGNGIKIKEGTNATMGRAVLVAGTVVVSTTKVTANSEIFLTNNVNGGTLGSLSVSARTAGTSFTITSSSALDTSTISWLIIEPS